MTSPVENLLTVLAVVKKHAPKSTATWFCEGVERFMQKSGGLDSCLNLKAKQGGNHVYDEYRLWLRNEALKAAWNHCAGSTSWQRSSALAAEIERFSQLWTCLKDESLNPQWSALRQALYRAFVVGLPIPKTARALHDICLSVK